MSIPVPRTPRDDEYYADQRVTLFDVSWEGFEAQLALRGDAPVPRVAYLDGVLELMSLSVNHERVKSNIGRLLEAYAMERGMDLQPYGSWLIRSQPKTAGLEPDECYVFGSVQPRDPVRPDLAIEVFWSRNGIDKLEIYRRLEVPEVWAWRDDAIVIFALQGARYEVATASRYFPEIDLGLLTSFLDRIPVTQAIREYVAALRS